MRYGGSEFLGEGGLDRQVTAQDAFTGAFGKDSLISGVKAGLTAGLNKTGGYIWKCWKVWTKINWSWSWLFNWSCTNTFLYSIFCYG